MLTAIVESAIEYGPRLLGLVVLKALTLGRYRRSGRDVAVVEGAAGFAAVAAICAVGYWLAS